MHTAQPVISQPINPDPCGYRTEGRELMAATPKSVALASTLRANEPEETNRTALSSDQLVRIALAAIRNTQGHSIARGLVITAGSSAYAGCDSGEG